MKRKTNICFALIVILLFGVVMSGCYKPDEGYEAVDPGELPAKIDGFDYEAARLGRYEQPIKITVAAIDYPLEEGVKEGTTPYNQSFNAIVKKVLNIDLEYTVVASTGNYDNRLNLAIMGGEEPDMFYTTKSDVFTSLKAQERLADLGPSFWYLNEELQSIYLNVIPDVLKNVMEKGKLYSFPMAGNTYESAQKLYIRKDWLDICGVETPSKLTMQELIALGETFLAKGDDIVAQTKVPVASADDLIPLSFHNEVMFTGTASASGIMQACGASPDAYFLDEKTGELYASNTSQEMRNALEVMADMYQKGIIDQQFTTKNIDKVYEDIKSGKVGMVFGQWWLPNGEINTTVGNIEGADWICVDLPSYNGNEALPIVKRVNLTGYNCVSSKCRYPEAAAKIINLFYDIYYNDHPEDTYKTEIVELMKPENGFFYNMVPIKVWNAISSVEEYKRVNAVFKNAYELGVRISYDSQGNLTSDSWRILPVDQVSALNATDKAKYEAQLAEYNKLKTREKELHWDKGYPYYCAVRAGTPISQMTARVKQGWGIYHCMVADDCGYDQVTRLTEGTLTARYDEFYGPVLSMMEENSGYLSNTLSKTVYMQIITGQKDISYFDSYYVKQYATNGGDKIIKQVNLWYKANNPEDK